MTSRERLLTVLRGSKPDRLPWAPLIDEYFTSSLPSGLEMDVVETLRYIGADVMERHVPVIKERCEKVAVEEEREGNDIVKRFITPAGTLTEKQRVTATTTFRSEFRIKGRDDLEAYRYIVENTEYEPNYEAFRQRDLSIGEDGLATADGPRTPIQRLLQDDMGLEGVVYGLVDYKEELESVMRTMHERNKEVYRLICRSPAEAVIAYEDTSSTVISPSYFHKYCAPFIDEYADICHDAGKWFITHMCGKLSVFNEQIKAGHQDGVDSVCPPPTGDTWPHEAREAWGLEKVIIGGIDPPTLARMSVEETREYVTRVLDQMPTFGGFILSTGDATAYGTPVENLRAVAQIVTS